MGLDMYLYGEKYHWTDWEHPEKNLMEDGCKLKTKTLELGYWRKHPDLHGFIVNTFANGVDECQRIELTVEQLQQIIDAVKGASLPETTGFFFGESDDPDEQDTTKKIQGAIDWLNQKEANISKTVYYEASW